jgi:hypothetical protein
MLKNRIQNPEMKIFSLQILNKNFTIFLGLFGVTFGEEAAPPDDCARELPIKK